MSPIHNVKHVFSWYLNTTQMFTLVKLKNNTNITSTPEQPHRSFSPPQSTAVHRSPPDASVNPFFHWIPPTSREDLLSTASPSGGMMGVVGKAERHSEACPRGRGSGITWFCSRSSVSVPAGWTWTQRCEGSVSLGPAVTALLHTHSLVEGLGLVPQMFRLCHEVVQLFSSLQKTFHGVVLQEAKNHKMKMRAVFSNRKQLKNRSFQCANNSCFFIRTMSDSPYQNNLGLIQLSLHFGHCICFFGVLEWKHTNNMFLARLLFRKNRKINQVSHSYVIFWFISLHHSCGLYRPTSLRCHKKSSWCLTFIVLIHIIIHFCTQGHILHYFHAKRCLASIFIV